MKRKDVEKENNFMAKEVYKYFDKETFRLSRLGRYIYVKGKERILKYKLCKRYVGIFGDYYFISEKKVRKGNEKI